MNFPGALVHGDRHQRRRRLVGHLRGRRGANHGFTGIGGTFTTVDNPAARSSTRRSASTTRTKPSAITRRPEAELRATSPIRRQAACSPTSTRCCPPTSTVRRSASIAQPRLGSSDFYQPDCGPRHLVRLCRRGRHDHHHRSVRLDVHPGAGRQRPGRDRWLLRRRNGNQHGYIENGGVFTSFDPPGSASTTINGINDKGDIVGFYTSASGRRHRLCRNSRAGAVDLDDDACRLRRPRLCGLSGGAARTTPAPRQGGTLASP